MPNWIKNLLKYKAVKIGAGIIGSGGLLSIFVTIYIWTVDGITSRAEASEMRIIKYVDDKNLATIELFNEKNTNLKSGQSDIKKILIIMNKRLYDLQGRK